MAKETYTHRVKQHTVYRLEDGKRVPGVTTILSVLNKPVLVKWANNLGLQGIDSSKYVDEKATIGTCCHYMVECHVKGSKPDLSEFSPHDVELAENGFLKFLDWEKLYGPLVLLGSEMVLVSEAMRCGGTIDLFVELNGIPTLLDIKTSGSGIWPEMKHQVSAYNAILWENGYRPEQVFILRVGRSADEGFEFQRIGNLDKHLRVFELCRELYDLNSELKS
jgi:hypothetical protein